MQGFPEIPEQDKLPWYKRWAGNMLAAFVNMPWTVSLPPDCGTAKFVGSTSNIVLDLSQTNFTGDTDKLEDMIVVLNGTGYYTNILTDGRLEEI